MRREYISLLADAALREEFVKQLVIGTLIKFHDWAAIGIEL
jgi:hypothetical protein